MKIHHVNIRNFRKLKNCRIDFDEEQTILVGANNSGKTSAMSALVWFLKEPKRFTTQEFTLTNWYAINDLANKWTKEKEEKEDLLNTNLWDKWVPSLDVWFDVDEQDVYRVLHILPSLDWENGLVGVRLRFEPKDIKELYHKYLKEARRVKELKETELYQNGDAFKIYPEDMWDFLNHDGNLLKYFEVKYYVLDQSKIDDNDVDTVQDTPNICLEQNPLTNLLKVESVEAYRDFSDPSGRNDNEIDTLSKQFQDLYRVLTKDKNDSNEGDLSLTRGITQANEAADKKIQTTLEDAIEELKNINYPGFYDPDITIESRIDIANAISHESSVRFALQGKEKLSLSEKYNGLGLRNLISIYLKLIKFRNQWIHYHTNENDESPIEPILLVLIEEPEAHLHPQAQQVFIRKACNALGIPKDLNLPSLTPQLVLTTHSNHVVNEVEMKCIRYFKRQKRENNQIPISRVVNMSHVFGEDKETEKFVTRYMKLMHYDLFFADGIIMVEGVAEKILTPQFIRKMEMDSNYIAIIEINGSHAHRFKPLVDKLEIPTLVITDIDSQHIEQNRWKACLPKLNENQTTNNDTIKIWLSKENIVDLLELDKKKKEVGDVMVTYQTGIDVEWEEGKTSTVYPYTFEDALIFTNLDKFRQGDLKKMGSITTINKLLNENQDISSFHEVFFKKLEQGSLKKADLATWLVFSDKFEELTIPQYIKEGLEWLNAKLYGNI